MGRRRKLRLSAAGALRRSRRPSRRRRSRDRQRRDPLQRRRPRASPGTPRLARLSDPNKKGGAPLMLDVPKIISVDDHVLEPGDLWTNRLPARLRERAPRLVPTKGRFGAGARGDWVEDENGRWADIWKFEGYQMAIIPGFAAAGMDQDYLGEHWEPMTYEEMRPGAYDQAARLADLDANHTDASLAFPTFPRFCGQTFLENPDRELGLACVQAYNDWMIDEWCAGAGTRAAHPADVDSPVGSRARGCRSAALRGQGIVRDGVLGEPRETQAAQHPLGTLGSALCGVRGHRHGRQPPHRVVVDVPVHLARCAACGVPRTHCPGRHSRARRLAHVGRAGSLPGAESGVERGPGRLDPVPPRTSRQRVARPARLRRHP